MAFYFGDFKNQTDKTFIEGITNQNFLNHSNDQVTASMFHSYDKNQVNYYDLNFFNQSLNKQNFMPSLNDMSYHIDNSYNLKIDLDNQNFQRQMSFIETSSDSNELIKKTKIKKSRVLFSQWQINELEKLFKKQKYLTTNERELMAKRLKLHSNQVKIWFQNRRYKIKKREESTTSI